ncbi:MAG: hypothetical protein COW85_00900 [Ignavibacteria bacterium CG22_combo_CG10-13_8_21_14_all_37_15]|nr:MAG: hypothetical protein COW85_00900 [Ignavibacteria bacterium CG22_combo_CG10-13_8_21_14_all_37_15]
MNKDNFKIAAVVVTYNRLELLKECVDAIRNQTRKLDEIIVVNNSSTDGTLEWLNVQKDLTVITQENSGSAGGQYTGIKTAYEKGYDWIWCLDCDVVVDKFALEELINTEEFDLDSIGFLSSTIYYKDKNLAYANIPELGNSYDLLTSVLNNKPIPIISASFGSLLLPRKVISKVGYPSKDFFIWGDDAEFTLRIILRNFKGFIVINSKACHFNNENNPNPYSTLKIDSTRFIYGVRNMVYVALLRNRITHNSILRGYFSGLGFVIRIYSQRELINNESKLKLFTKLIILYIKGVTFKPTKLFPIR